MFIDFLLDVFREAPENDAIVWQDRAFSYGDLFQRIEDCRVSIGEQGTCRTWIANDGSCAAELDLGVRPLRAAAFAGRGTRLAVVGAQGEVQVWKTTDGPRME